MTDTHRYSSIRLLVPVRLIAWGNISPYESYETGESIPPGTIFTIAGKDLSWDEELGHPLINHGPQWYRLEPEHYEPIPGSLIAFNLLCGKGGYGRTAEATILPEEQCDKCNENKPLVLFCDASDGEYSSINLCLECIQQAFKDAEKAFLG